MTKQLSPLDYFIALGQTCLMQSRNYKNNEVVALKNGEKHTTQELGGIIETALKNYQELLEKPYVLVVGTHGHAQALIDKMNNHKDIKIANLEDGNKLKALNEILALHDKWLGDEMSDFEFFTLLNEARDKYGLLKEVLL